MLQTEYEHSHVDEPFQLIEQVSTPSLYTKTAYMPFDTDLPHYETPHQEQPGFLHKPAGIVADIPSRGVVRGVSSELGCVENGFRVT